MVLSRNKKNNVSSCKPQFYYIKVEFKGSKSYRYVFVMCWDATARVQDGVNQYDLSMLEITFSLYAA